MGRAQVSRPGLMMPAVEACRPALWRLSHSWRTSRRWTGDRAS